MFFFNVVFYLYIYVCLLVIGFFCLVIIIIIMWNWKYFFDKIMNIIDLLKKVKKYFCCEVLFLMF